MSHSIRFVLLQPRFPENVGAAARALKNFGWTDWAIVDPAFEDWEPTRRMAVQAEDVLDSVHRPRSAGDALADCTWIVGTSSRRRRGQRSLTPRDFATRANEELSRGKVALVFGEERSGLTNDVLDVCHDVSTVPTDPGQPSINLAQAVLLYAYECRLAAHALRPHAVGALPEGATQEALVALQETLRSTLIHGRFLHDDRDSVLLDLMSPLIRSRLTRREADLWMSALRALGKQLK